MNNVLLTQRERAVELLREIFARQDRILVSDAVRLAAEQGITRGTLTRARHDIGATLVKNGRLPGFWEAPKTPPVSQALLGTHQVGAGRGAVSKAAS